MIGSKEVCRLINQVFELEKKLEADNHSATRNVKRIRSMVADWGYTFESPIDQKYDDTRTDCEADIAGDVTKALFITQVIKPIIYFEENGFKSIEQKAVVIVEN